MTLQEYQQHIEYTAGLVRLVARENVQSICTCAKNIQTHFKDDEIDKLSDDVIYDAYIRCTKKEGSEEDD